MLLFVLHLLGDLLEIGSRSCELRRLSVLQQDFQGPQRVLFLRASSALQTLCIGQVLRCFEIMMRERTRETYENFWNFVYRAYYNPREISAGTSVQNMIREIIVCFMAGQDGLGPPHLMSLPDHCLDVAFSTVALTANFWDERAGEPLLITCLLY